MKPPPPTDLTPTLSIVVPALNEQDNVGPLAEEVARTLNERDGLDVELIIVDDGSDDQTPHRLAELCRKHPWVVALRRERPEGQSAAMYAGIQAARGAYVATLDADLQNDPGELGAMLALLQKHNADLVQGDRSADRQDTFMRRRASGVGRGARRLILGDPVRDTGCSARVLRAEYAKQLPLQFKGMHRFVPAYCRLLGAKIVEMPVKHRRRHSGTTKYGVGVLSRGLRGLVDCFAVRWMARRIRPTQVSRISTTQEAE
ncbi:MAG: glycosyltransferase family 2 protein [Phycisphaerae bacterium]